MVTPTFDLKDIRKRFEHLKDCLHIEDKVNQEAELSMRMHDPAFWENREEAEKITKEWNSLKKTLFDIYLLEDDISILELSSDDEISEEIILYNTCNEILTKYESQMMLGNEEDKMSAVLKIVAGAGGTEAQDWAEMLMRMYTKYFANHGYTSIITNYQKGDTAGIKTISFNVYGEYAYGYLKSETGIHRLVRVSPYNAQGKRMTSFASVFVCPLIDDTIEININPANITMDTFRSSGAGGQNVNKVESGVRLHYKFINPLTGEEDELVAECTESRDQPNNKKIAMQHLRSQLYELELEKRRQIQAEVENKKMPIGWGAQIRSYVFDDKRVKDHRTNYQTSDVDSVMNGNIDEFIKTYLMEF